MEYRKLGQSDLVTSVIGFGGFPIGRGHRGCRLDGPGGAPGPCLAGERLESYSRG